MVSHLGQYYKQLSEKLGRMNWQVGFTFNGEIPACCTRVHGNMQSEATMHLKVCQLGFSCIIFKVLGFSLCLVPVCLCI